MLFKDPWNCLTSFIFHLLYRNVQQLTIVIISIVESWPSTSWSGDNHEPKHNQPHLNSAQGKDILPCDVNNI